jgi:hypothetical protein
MQVRVNVVELCSYHSATLCLAVQYLLQPKQLSTEGIFRLSADQHAIALFRDALDTGLWPRCAVHGVSVVTGALKQWLRELPQPCKRV